MRPHGRILVIGAGLGGLTAALALLRAGWEVRVYERAPALGEVGAGISLSRGICRALGRLGLESALIAASLPVPTVAFVHYRTGALRAGAFQRDLPPETGLSTGRHIHRADLHKMLLDAVRALAPDCVITGHHLMRVTQDENGVRAWFDHGVTADGTLLVAADGARSVVRNSVFGDAPPTFAGQAAFRCLVPRDIAQPFLGAGNAVVSIGPGRTFHRYFLRNGTVVNVVGIARSEIWHEEGWNTPATRAEFLEAFRGFHPDVIGLIGLAPEDTLIKWGLFVRPTAPVWSRGRIVLLGDAAHPILPFLGLGAALAIEDAVVLERALAMAANFEDALRIYQAARFDRVEAVRTNTIRQGDLIQTADPDREDYTVAPAGNPTLFDYDPGEVALAGA